MYDLIIIGGGPAGATAGIYASRKKIKTLLITKNFGGLMAGKSVTIENYPGFEEISGSELIGRFEKHLKKQKIEIENDSVVKIEKNNQEFSVLTEKKKQFQSKAIIIASGSEPRNLGLPEEKEFIGRGVSYCSTCDGPFFSHKDVAVAGGGNSGFETAISLTSYAKKVYILEAGKELRADEVLQEKAKQTGKIEVITGASIKKIQGEKFVNSLVFEDQKKDIKTLEVKGLFVEIGWKPATSFAKGLIDLNEKGEIVIDFKNNQTNVPGLFAAGDSSSVLYKQIIVAAGEGAKAALSAYDYLNNLK
ncbi:MAG: FAD-dependent oxidoreductase [Candidatus Nealsonbacteria bacterium]|nr:FAD-dependent oxidoreductase [Candidatus Nealsonbacteria bacterium]